MSMTNKLSTSLIKRSGKKGSIFHVVNSKNGVLTLKDGNYRTVNVSEVFIEYHVHIMCK